MPNQSDVLKADGLFFGALVRSEVSELGDLLVDDFSLADISGGLLSKGALTAAVGSRKLHFESIEPAETVVRFYGATAIVTGCTEMRGSFEQTPFVLRSRYTHVYVEREGRLYLAAAQGTPIPSDGTQQPRRN